MWKLLVIDDEPERTEQIADWFEAIDHEYAVIRAHSGEEGLQKANDLQPDIILLDIVMPGMDGHEVLLRLKRSKATQSIPVVICSFRADEEDGLKELMVRDLREGADYVVARKWGLLALEEVVKKLLSSSARQEVIRVRGNELKLGEGCKKVWVNGQEVKLTPLRARVLAHLHGKRGQACHVNEILDQVYGGVGDANSVYKIIDQIRQKIEPDPRNPIFLANEKGFGYKLVAGE
jgi:DNA-binding response OmpR family regulator